MTAPTDDLVPLLGILFALIFLVGTPIAWAFAQIGAERDRRLFRKLLQEERDAKR